MTLHRFECSVKNAPWGEDHWTTVHAFTRGQAKADYWRDVVDAWQDIPFTAVRCRGPFTPCDTEAFVHTATYRGRLDLHIGSTVEYRGKTGCIVDRNDSANFEVLFTDGSRLHFHPSEIPVQGGAA